MSTQALSNVPVTPLTAGTVAGVGIFIIDGSGNIVSSFGGAGGTAQADNSAFTAGTTSTTPIAGLYQATPTAATTGRVATAGITEFRALKVSLHDTAGNPVTSLSAGSPSSRFHLVLAATTNAANIKASAGVLWGIQVFSARATPFYIKLHNTAGTPTAGAAVVYTVGVQAGTHVHIGFPNGITFSAGIGITVVTGITDASAVAVAADDGVVDIQYT